MKYLPIYMIVLSFGFERLRSFSFFPLFPFLIFVGCIPFSVFDEEVFCALPRLNTLITTDVTELFTRICTETIVTVKEPHETAHWAHIHIMHECYRRRRRRFYAHIRCT